MIHKFLESKLYRKTFIFFSSLFKKLFGNDAHSKLSFSHRYLKAKYLKILDNDLEKVALNKYPELKRIKSYLSGLPNALFARMSGSGSSIVAYFHSKRACKKAYSQYKRKFNSYWCIESKTI